jgi:hypothetical protein
MEPKLDLSGITIGGEDDHMGGYEPSVITSNTITLSSLKYNNAVVGGGVYTTAGTSDPFATRSSPYTYNPWTSNPSGKIRLDGADADIEINGISLLTTMQEIQNRLNLLQPNTALEAEWEELYALGRKYRELEQQIKEKQATWDRLKAMPPPVID